MSGTSRPKPKLKWMRDSSHATSAWTLVLEVPGEKQQKVAKAQTASASSSLWYSYRYDCPAIPYWNTCQQPKPLLVVQEETLKLVRQHHPAFQSVAP